MTTDQTETADLPARLEAALTERYTELGNPFSAMRRQEQGPDGWPASHPVGPHHVAEVLRELLPAATVSPPATPADTQPVASTAPLASGLPLVQGRCPACGRASLFLGDGGYVTCSLVDCPEPDAASTMLERRTPAADTVTPSRRAGLRDEIRRAVCEAEGFAWDSDMLEPDEYGEVADQVLAVLYREWPWLRAEAEDAAEFKGSATGLNFGGANSSGLEPEPSDPTQCSGDEGFCPEHGFHRHSLKQPGTPDDGDRRARYAAVIRRWWDAADGGAEEIADAVMAVADREQADVRRVVGRLAAHAVGFQDVLDDADRGPWGRTVGADIAELRRLVNVRSEQQAVRLRELEQHHRPNTPPSRPEPRIPDHTVNEEEAPAPVKQRADCTETEWAEQERARFERLYTRETVRADQAEELLRIAHDTSNRSEAERARAVQRAETAEARVAELERQQTGQRATVLREAADYAEATAEALRGQHEFRRSTGALDVMTVLRRLADETAAGEAQQPETQAKEAPAVCEGFVWIGQSFATCERCSQPAWDHAGRDTAAEGAGPFDTRRTVIPWEPGEADRIRAKWAPAVEIVEGPQTVSHNFTNTVEAEPTPEQPT